MFSWYPLLAASLSALVTPSQRVGTDTAECGGWSNGEGRRQVTVCRAGGPIHIDGTRSEAAWDRAARIDLPYEIYPGNNSDARVATSCYLTFDDDHVLVSCDAADPDPSAIRAFFAPRDEVGRHDRIGIVLDPFNDARRAFEFVITPLGVQADAAFDQQRGGVDPSWDAIWHSAGRITERGYTIEASIPFQSLPFPGTDGMQTWGIYIWRVRPRSEDVETRSVPLDRGNNCLLCQADRVVGFQDITPGRNVQLTPTLTGARPETRPQFPSGALESDALHVEFGADAQWSPTPDLTLTATANPDFSQVEADVAQLDVNNRFTLFFPEKRPFFLEGADFFATPLQAVFTRTIADPVFGTKLTGKVGGTALGAVFASDRINNLLLPANQSSSLAAIDADVATAIGRIRRDVGASSTVGVLYTGREGAGYHNRVLGIDGFLQPLRPLTLRLHVLRSHTEYPDSFATLHAQPSKAIAGTAARAQLDYNSRTWRGQAFARVLDPTFRADAGFIEQVDVREANVFVQRQFWGQQGGWFARFNLTSGLWDKRDSDGMLTERVFWGNVLYLGPELLRVFLDYQRRREFFQGSYYTLDRYRAEVGIAPTGNLQLSVGARTGDAIDLRNGRAATQLQLQSSLGLRLGRHADLTFSHALEQLSDGGTTIVTAHLPQVRAVYNLNAHALVRAIAQYRNTNRNPAAYAEPVNANQRHLFVQLLFAYEATPQTLLFLGYADARDGFTDPDHTVVPLTVQSRTLFMKLSYAWRP